MICKVCKKRMNKCVSFQKDKIEKYYACRNCGHETEHKKTKTLYVMPDIFH